MLKVGEVPLSLKHHCCANIDGKSHPSVYYCSIKQYFQAIKCILINSKVNSRINYACLSCAYTSAFFHILLSHIVFYNVL